MNASVFRNSKFELRQLVQGPNSFGLLVSERGVFGSSPSPIEVPEGDFTDAEMQQVHNALALLETKAAAVYQRKLDELGADADKLPAEKLHALVKAADDAKAAKMAADLETARIEAEALVKRAEAEEFDRNQAVLRAAAEADIAAKRAELEALSRDLAAKREAAQAPQPATAPTPSADGPTPEG